MVKRRKINVDFWAADSDNVAMFDTAGSRLNFPVVAGVEETFRVSFYVGGGSVSVLGATFQAGCYEEHGDERGELVAMLPVEHDSAENKVLLTVPELAEGHYWWELRATDAVGKECRLLYGTLTALTSAEVARLGNVAEESELRELAVEIGDGYAKPLILRWQACSVAASMAADAARAAERAEAAAGSAMDAAEDVLGKLVAATAFMKSFHSALFEAIRVIDGYLWVGGVNTGHVLRGDDGVTPHIGADGCWYVGVKKLSDRPAFGQDGITPHITADGFWAFGETRTGVRAEGRDGVDGTAVRRVLVESYADIPQVGDTCNGGFLYYVPAGVERAQRQVCSVPAGASVSNYTLRGPLVFADGRTWTRRGGRLLRMGLMAGSNTQGGEPSAEKLYAHLYYELAGEWLYAGRSVAAVAQVVNAVSWWEFADLEVVPTGGRVKVVFAQVEMEPTEEQVETVRVQVVPVVATEGSKVGEAHFCAWVYWGFETDELTAYDVYAWCEADGAGGWVRVDVNYDIARSDLYGLTKLGMDQVVVNGAPVGVNAAGQMAVPIANAALPGAVLPSSTSTASDGGLTHVGGDRKLYVGMATLSMPGVGRTSYNRVVEDTNSVGLTETGKFAVPRAEAFQWGVVKVGTSVPQSMGMPWIIPVGAAAEGVHNEYGQNIRGQLMNNVLVGGALRTAVKETWAGWAPGGIDTSVLPDGSNAVGLMTSGSFRQSAERGLELVEATGQLLGGVTVCSTIGSGSGLVPSAEAVVNYLSENYYTKGQTYGRDEVYSKQQVDDLNKKNREDAAAKYKTIETAKREHDVLKAAVEGRMRRSDTVEEIRQLTLSEYQALAVRDEKCLYLVTED